VPFIVQGVQPRGNRIWAVRAAWSSNLRPSLLVEQRRDNHVVQSWVVHQVPDGNGWALLWGDAPDEELDLRTGDTLTLDGGQDVGLGDVVAAFTSALGIKPCGGCKQRQEWLNKKVPQVYRRRRR
jgi:hypothetical protein